jgi:hypothetical protein
VIVSSIFCLLMGLSFAMRLLHFRG